MKRRECQQQAGEDASKEHVLSIVAESVWATFPEELLLQQVLCKLYIKDLLRMCAVSRSWNTAIHSQLVLNKQPTSRRDLPWFYCMVSSKRVQVGHFGELFVAFDPNINRWHWLQYPVQTRIASLAPVCSLGRLVCWDVIREHGYPSCVFRLLVISNTFTKYKEVLDVSQYFERLSPYEKCCLQLEKDDSGDISLVIISWKDQKPGQVSIARYNILMQGETTPSDDIEKGNPLTAEKCHGQKLLQWDYKHGSFRLPQRMYYHQGKLAFIHPSKRYFSDSVCELDLFLFDGENWSRVCMPRFSKSDGVMLRAKYQIVQMDADLLLLVLKRKPTSLVRQVFLYKFNFVDRVWLLLSNKLIVSFQRAYLMSHSNDFSLQSAAQAGLVMVSIEKQVYLFDMKSSSWRLLPPCYGPPYAHELADASQLFPIEVVLCPLDPTP